MRAPRPRARLAGRMLRWAGLGGDRAAALVGDLEEDYSASTPGLTTTASYLLAVARLAIGYGLWRQVRTVRPWTLVTGMFAGGVRDLRLAIRSLIRRRTTSVVSILTLAIGIGAATAVFSVVNAVLLRPFPYPEPGRLMTIWRTYPDWRADPILSASWNRISLSFPEFFDLRSRSATVSHLAVQETRLVVVGQGDTSSERRAGVASASLFDLLGVKPVTGRLFTGDDDDHDRHVVVIGDELWRSVFGSDRRIVGQSVLVDNTPRVVLGVVPTELDFAIGALRDLWLPLSAVPADEKAWNNRNLDALGQLNSRVSTDDARREWDRLLQDARLSSRTGAEVTPLLAERTNNFRLPLLVLLAAVGLLLAVAGLNVSALLVASTAARRREIAVRTALGASRWRIVRYLLVESLCLCAAGAAVGVAVASGGIRALVAIAPAGVPRLDQAVIDGPVCLFAIAVMGVVTLLCGLGPGLSLARGGAWLRAGRGTDTTGRRHLQRGLIVAQVALSVVLLVGAGLFVRTLIALERVEPGFDRSHVLTFRVWMPSPRFNADSRASLLATALPRLAALPGVEVAATTSGVPFVDGRASTSIVLDAGGAGGTPEVEAQRRVVSADFLRALRIPIIAGRPLASTDRAGAPRVAVVSEEMARRFFQGYAVGRRFQLSHEWVEIVGVSGDVREGSLAAAPRATFYLPYTQWPPWTIMRLVLRTSADPIALAPAVRTAMASVDRSTPAADIAAVDERVARSLADNAFRARLLAVFAAAAAVLASVGLYGTVSGMVVARRREIGVRLALGAAPGRVGALFLARGLSLVGAGSAIGIALATSLARLVRAMLFGVEPTDTATDAAVLALMTIVALAASLGPARRASAVNPVDVLRAD